MVLHRSSSPLCLYTAVTKTSLFFWTASSWLTCRPRPQAHQQSRKADRLLAAGKYEAAIACHNSAAGGSSYCGQLQHGSSSKLQRSAEQLSQERVSRERVSRERVSRERASRERASRERVRSLLNRLEHAGCHLQVNKVLYTNTLFMRWEMSPSKQKDKKAAFQKRQNEMIINIRSSRSPS